MSNEKREFLKTMSPKFRVSFPQVFKPKAFKEGQDPKYSIVMLFDKEAQNSEAFKSMKMQAKKAFVRKFGQKVWDEATKDDFNWPILHNNQVFKNPFRKGSEKSEKYEGYGDDVIFVTASSKNRPGLVDEKLQDIISEEIFYAGSYARATVNAYEYDTGSNRGVSFGLNNIQKLADGDAFSGKVAAKDEFDAVETTSNSSDDSSSDDGYDF